MEDITTIKIQKSIKQELDTIKIIPEESYNHIVIRLIKYYIKNNINKTLIEK